jgi:hypothetical protein
LETARSILSQLNRVGAHVVGVALNRVNSRKISFSRDQNLHIWATTRKRLVPVVKKLLNRKVTADLQR